MGSEIPVSNPGGRGQRGCCGGDSSDMWICRLRSGGTECAAGPRASGVDDPAEGIGIGIDGAVKGSDVDEDVPSVSATQEEAVLGQSFLGQRVLRGYGGIGCGHDTKVCPLSGGEGEAVGTASTMLRDQLRHNVEPCLLWGQGPVPPMGGLIKAAPCGCGYLSNHKNSAYWRIAEIKTIKSPTVQKAVYEELIDALLSGRIAPGEKITIEGLAKSMGVSIMPVRAALQKLEGENFITVGKNRRIIVTELTSENLVELLEIRLVLECYAAEKACTIRER